MMRPMKMAGDQLIFGQGCLEHLKTIPGQKAVVVVGGSSMEKSGNLQKVIDYLAQIPMAVLVFKGVEPDPTFDTIMKGAAFMIKHQPDWIVALGGGSAMDAAKGMWIFYEHPELTSLKDIMPPNPFPKLRSKARLICIPSTSGTASEVSRSIVITDNKTNLKHGIGNMEMMPDVAILDPTITLSMPPSITAETGMDALTHGLEALVSNRSNVISHVLVKAAIKDIFVYLPLAWENGEDLFFREKMLNASMMAGLAFTNVSLGIIHAMAHTLGSLFSIAHGLADAILLPFIIEFNSANGEAKSLYEEIEQDISRSTLGIDHALSKGSLVSRILELNQKLGIPADFSNLISEEEYMISLPQMVYLALQDGCTKTNPILPSKEEMEALFIRIYKR